MKEKIALFILFSATASILLGQAWMTNLPQEKRGSSNFNDIIESYYELEEASGPVQGAKQFKRMEFFLEGRMDDNGQFPVETFWEEATSVMYERFYKTNLYGEWTDLGPFGAPMLLDGSRPGGNGRLDCITFHPTDPDIIFVGSPSGGLWKTTDHGQSWITLTDDLPTIGVADLVIDPVDTDIMYLATGTRDTWWETYSAGILKTYDGGITWEETGLNYLIKQQRSVSKIIMDPNDRNTLLAATSVGIWKSSDAGDSWDIVEPGNFKDLAFRPGDFSIIYATKFNYFGGARLYMSSDSGDNFSAIQVDGLIPTHSNRITIGLTPADPDVVYLLSSSSNDSGFHGVWRSDDAGQTWDHVSQGTPYNLLGWAVSGFDSGGQGWYTLALAVSPTDPDHVFVGGVNIWESFDGGANWQINSHWLGQGGNDYVHADIHSLDYNPINDILYTGVDGGIYELQAGGSEWEDLTGDILSYQIYRLGLYENDDQMAIVSPQDNGTTLFRDGNVNEIVLAEACDNFIDPQDPDVLYYGGYGAGVLRSDDGGYTPISIQPPGETNLRFNPPFIMDYNDNNTIYCAFLDVYKSTNRGNTWDKISNGFLGGFYFSMLEVAPSDNAYLYGGNGGGVWMTSDGGTIWNNISNGVITSVGASDIAISYSDPETIWVTKNGFADGDKVFKSSDAGQSWENISMNLPNVSVNCVVYENGPANGVYVGTDVGIYYINDNLSEWVDFSNGLPNVIVLELEINYKESKIKAATYGRGLWESPLISPSVSVPDIATDEMLMVFPNPSDGNITIVTEYSETDTPTLEVFDMSNRRIHMEVLPTGTKRQYIELDLSSYPSGTYIVRLSETSGYVMTRKVVIM